MDVCLAARTSGWSSDRRQHGLKSLNMSCNSSGQKAALVLEHGLFPGNGDLGAALAWLPSFPQQLPLQMFRSVTPVPGNLGLLSPPCEARCAHWAQRLFCSAGCWHDVVRICSWRAQGHVLFACLVTCCGLEQPSRSRTSVFSSTMLIAGILNYTYTNPTPSRFSKVHLISKRPRRQRQQPTCTSH